MDYTQIEGWKLLAGLGLFLIGMTWLEDGIKALVGREFKKFLQHQTGNSIKAVIAGAITTGVMQSSSVVTLLVMTFTGAGIIGLQNGIGMILGANLGTTLTGWIVTLIGFKFNLENLFLPITAIGSILFIFSGNGKANQSGRLLFGFGLMFMGLHYMKEGFMQFAQSADLTVLAGKPGILFVLFGFVLAAAIRSSSASMMIFLASLSSGSITLLQAGYLAIGADMGTTITGLMGTINGNAVRKKTGWSQFVINIITGLITLLLIKPLFLLISSFGITDPLISLVTFHSSFNLLGILIFLPFLSLFTRLLDKYVHDNRKSLAKYIPFVSLKDNLTALEAITNECSLFIDRAALCRRCFFEKKPLRDPRDAYFELKDYENEIFAFVSAVMKNKLNDNEAKVIQSIFSSIRSATLSVKDLKDIDHNISEFSQSSNESVFQFCTKLITEKNEFDLRLRKNFLENFHFDHEMFQDFTQDIDAQYEANKHTALTIYSLKQDFDLASLLNMVREMRDSAKLMLTALSQHHEAQPLLNSM